MEGKRVLRSLTLRNILSFGPEGQRIELEPLNVLIGPNGSGKTNLIEVLGLLRTLPTEFPASVQARGGVSEWLWKGLRDGVVAEISSTWDLNWREQTHTVTHEIAFEKVAEGLSVRREKVRESLDGTTIDHYDRLTFIPKNDTFGISVYDFLEKNPKQLTRSWKTSDHSVLSFLRDEDRYPGLTRLAECFSETRLFRKWTFGPDCPVRSPRRSDQGPSDFLAEDSGNLALILQKMLTQDAIKATLVDYLKRFYEDASDLLVVPVTSLFLELELREVEGYETPASRLSDGTLRFLTLLAILCHPAPPPLICIEEPELGLHPDIIPTIANLLIEASQRTQLIVTTHSSDLITSLWECPEAVVVCERRFGPTTLERLEPERMRKWLEKYSLGELWAMGEIGGNRW